MINQKLQEAAENYSLENCPAERHGPFNGCTCYALEAGFLAGAAHMQAQSAGVWVRARERLPQMERPIVARLDGCTLRTGNFFEDRGDCKFFVNHKVGFLISSDKFCNIEWLDGSLTTGGESEAVAFAEWCFIMAWFFVPESGKWHQGNECKDSAELYQLYKQCTSS